MPKHLSRSVDVMNCGPVQTKRNPTVAMVKTQRNAVLARDQTAKKPPPGPGLLEDWKHPSARCVLAQDYRNTLRSAPNRRESRPVGALRPQPPETKNEPKCRLECCAGRRDFAGIRSNPERAGIGEFQVERGCDPAIGRRNGDAGGGGAGDTCGGGGGVAAACRQGAAEDQAEAPVGAGRRKRRWQGADGRGDRGQAPRGASAAAGGFVRSRLPHVT